MKDNLTSDSNNIIKSSDTLYKFNTISNSFIPVPKNSNLYTLVSESWVYSE